MYVYFEPKDHPKIQYSFKEDPIDVVIPCTEKDLYTLETCIKGIRKNGKNIRRVIVVSSRRLTNQAEWVPESSFPFCKKDIAYWMFKKDATKAEKYIQTKKNRLGWVLQQLLKLYAPIVIPNISSNVLILDGDTVFLNPINFTTPKKGAYFTRSKEHHAPYFQHAKRLVPNFRKVLKHSGVAHHMLFQKAVILDLFKTVENYYQIPFWQAFCACIDLDQKYHSPCSEYEIYANFSKIRSDQFEERILLWDNIASLDHLDEYKEKKYSYISCHQYLRNSK